MQFSQIIGHTKLKQKMATTIAEGRIAHAQLFVGAEGTGALPLALAYAALVNCENPSANDSCGVCNSCNKINKLIHSDLHFTFPTVGKDVVSSDLMEPWRESISENPYMGYRDWVLKIGAEGKQGNINSKETADIFRRLSLKALEGKFKIQIIWGVEYLKEQGNKLLKILEEPPKGTLFILICEDPNQVLPTILSRAQLVQIPPIDYNSITTALMAEGVEEQVAKQTASLSSGSWLLAQSLSQNSSNDLFTYLKDFLNLSLFDSKVPERIRLIDSLSQWGREPLKLFLSYLIDMLHKAEHIAFQTNLAKTAFPDENAFLDKLAKMLTPYKTELIFKKANDAIMQIERNGNAKLVLFNLSLSVRNVLSN